MQNINKNRRDPRIVAEELERGKRHISFCIRIYELQHKNNRFVVQEHADLAKSWDMPEMIRLLAKDGVEVERIDMCAFGMVAVKDGVTGPAMKPTRIGSNSKEDLKRVAMRCPNRINPGTHEHIRLDEGRARQAQVNPAMFCEAIVSGIAAQKKLMTTGLTAVPMLELSEISEVAKSVGVYHENGVHPSDVLHEPDPTQEDMMAYDDLSGAELHPGLMRMARKEEIQYFKDMQVYTKVSVEECKKEIGRMPIPVRWVDINQGDAAAPNYRSRLVAKEFKTEERPEWYAATPPSECLKILLSRLAINNRSKLMYADVSRAYFYARAIRPVYVQLIDADREPGDEGMCGRLNVSMYGTRDAALTWAIKIRAHIGAGGLCAGEELPMFVLAPGEGGSSYGAR